MYDNMDVSVQTMRILAQGFKLGGEIAKGVLLLTLQKVKENKENKVGIQSLKALLKSKEELSIISLKKENLEAFKTRAKELGFTFATVSSPNSDMVKVMYKSRQVNQIKECLTEMLEHEKANKLDEVQEKNEYYEEKKEHEVGNNLDQYQETTVYNQLNDHLDFKSPEDNYTRYSVENVDNEKTSALSDLLKENGIDNDVVVVAVNENNTFNVLFRVNDKDKDKAREILKDNKDKNIDEILKTHRGGKREPLEAQIKRAKKEKGDRAIEGMLESMSKVLKKKSKEVDR